MNVKQSIRRSCYAASGIPTHLRLCCQLTESRVRHIIKIIYEVLTRFLDHRVTVESTCLISSSPGFDMAESNEQGM